jgi:putative transposase
MRQNYLVYDRRGCHGLSQTRRPVPWPSSARVNCPIRSDKRPVSRYRFIAAEKAHHSVVLLCRVLGVARSAFYAWQRQKASARAQADEQLADEIKDIYDDSRCSYGAPRVHAELRNRGKRIGRKRVARLMRKAGLIGRCPRRFRRTTIPDSTTQVQDLVQRQFRPSAPNQLWLSDITYIRTWEGWLYLAVHPGCVLAQGCRLGVS